MGKLTYKYRLYPTSAQNDILNDHLLEACRLYNAALQERRDAWKINKKSISVYDQAKQLKEVRANGDIDLPNFGVARNVLQRLDRAFAGFLSRKRKGIKAGPPRFKSSFRSFMYSPYGNGCKLLQSKLRLQGIGLIKVKLHRPLEGIVKAVVVKKEVGRWYVCFNVDIEPKSLPVKFNEVGIDVGLTTFATLSDGVEIPNPRIYSAAKGDLRIASRRMRRRKTGSKRWHKALQLLQKVHTRIKNRRNDFQHKTSRQLVNAYGKIVVEHLRIEEMMHGRLSKNITDAAWGSFLDKIAYKAENAGREFFRVNPKGTSQTCLCGALVPKDLIQRWHLCPSCGLSAHRDLVSAQLILAKARTEPSSAKGCNSILCLKSSP